MKYFFNRYGNGLMVYDHVNMGMDFYGTPHRNITIIVLNPSVKILQHNIKIRAYHLNLPQLIEEKYQLPHNNHKNFNSIIGYHQLLAWNYERFIIDNLIYAKSQKKWINYFLKNNFFNYDFSYYNIDF